MVRDFAPVALAEVAEVAELEDGVLRQRGRVDLIRDKVLEFARALQTNDEVVLEATGNTMAMCGCPSRMLGVVIATPLQVRTASCRSYASAVIGPGLASDMV